MPCFSNRRCAWRRTSPSMPGSTPSRNSTTVTCAPSRRHTEPSSSPITPAPTTSRCSGTLASASAPVDDTMRFSSISMPLSRATSEPVAMTMDLVSSVCVLPSAPLTSTLPGAAMRPAPMKGVDLVLLEQELDALDVAVDALVLERHHRREIELGRGHADAHLAEAVAGLLEQFGGVQQRLRRDAADIEAGAAEGRALFHHGGFQAELRRADGADIAAGAGADDDEVVGHTTLQIQHQCRAGSSRHSFTRTRKVTASRPSTMRWS